MIQDYRDLLLEYDWQEIELNKLNGLDINQWILYDTYIITIRIYPDNILNFTLLNKKANEALMSFQLSYLKQNLEFLSNSKYVIQLRRDSRINKIIPKTLEE